MVSFSPQSGCLIFQPKEKSSSFLRQKGKVNDPRATEIVKEINWLIFKNLLRQGENFSTL